MLWNIGTQCKTEERCIHYHYKTKMKPYLSDQKCKGRQDQILEVLWTKIALKNCQIQPHSSILYRTASMRIIFYGILFSVK